MNAADECRSFLPDKVVDGCSVILVVDVNTTGCFALTRWLTDLLQVLSMQPQPALVMVDSIQTMRTQDSTSSPGSVTQVRGTEHTVS